MNQNNIVWFITGCSSSIGFGINFVNYVLANGGSVAATTRSVETLMKNVNRDTINDNNFLAIEMDIKNESSIKSALELTINKFKKINIVVNNAGYGHFGAITDFTDREARDQLDVNFFGPLNVIRNSFPYLKMNQQNNELSRIVIISSLCGFNSNFPSFGLYCSSKFALSSIAETLNAEINRFNIKVISVMPGFFKTNFFGPFSMKVVENQNRKDYNDIYETIDHTMVRHNLNEGGDPKKCVQSVILNVLSQDPVLYFFVGADAFTFKSMKIDLINNDVANSLQYNNDKTEF